MTDKNKPAKLPLRYDVRILGLVALGVLFAAREAWNGPRPIANFIITFLFILMLGGLVIVGSRYQESLVGKLKAKTGSSVLAWTIGTIIMIVCMLAGAIVSYEVYNWAFAHFLSSATAFGIQLVQGTQ